MDENHLLTLNPRKVQRCLQGILTQNELHKIEAAVRANVRQLLALGRLHLSTAVRLTGPRTWRQAVSRGYYACYAASRAVRLANSGYYSQETKDHERVGELPDDFPDKMKWKDTLTKFRADRNVADYDHTLRERDLEMSSDDYMRHARQFLRTTAEYLRARGAL